MITTPQVYDSITTPISPFRYLFSQLDIIFYYSLKLNWQRLISYDLFPLLLTGLRSGDVLRTDFVEIMSMYRAR